MHAAPEILSLLFLIITFLQSGADKVLDWKGNLNWLKEHFANSPFKGIVSLLLASITIVELSAAFLCVSGLFQLLVTGNGRLALYGAMLACIALLMLLLGQRMARDYDGARTIAIYFMPAVFLVYLLIS